MKKALLIFIFSVLNIIAAHGQYCPIEYNLLTDFESNTDTIKIDTLSNNIWQIGEPDKIFFDTAYSGTKVIVTDSINPYPVNNYSSFTIRFDTPPWYMWQERTFLTFVHKFNTDSLKDGGYIEVSYDSINWTNVVNDTMPFIGICTTNFYTGTISNGEMAFTGNSNGWVTSCIHWIWDLGVKSINDPPNLIFIRFVFKSDSIQTNKDGWMIDDISFDFISYGSIMENSETPISIKVVPNPVNSISILRIENIKCRETQVEIFDISGKKVKDKTLINKDNYEIYRNDFYTGLYFYKITINGDYIRTGKFIIE